jgi:hypothetical protein
MPIPTFKGFIDPLLRVLGDSPDGLRAGAAHELVAERLGLTDTEMAERLPSGVQATFRNRNSWAQDRLKRAGLTENPRTGYWRITAGGTALLAQRPSALTEDDILRITDIQGGQQAEPWLERLAAFRADSSWAQELVASSAARTRAVPELKELVTKVREGRVTLRQFADEFGRRSRREWAGFGANGMIGTGGVSQLANRRGEDATFLRDFRRWLEAPASAEAAAAAIDEFAAYLTRERKAGPGMPVPACQSPASWSQVPRVSPPSWSHLIARVMEPPRRAG